MRFVFDYHQNLLLRLALRASRRLEKLRSVDASLGFHRLPFFLLSSIRLRKQKNAEPIACLEGGCYDEQLQTAQTRGSAAAPCGLLGWFGFNGRLF